MQRQVMKSSQIGSAYLANSPVLLWTIPLRASELYEKNPQGIRRRGGVGVGVIVAAVQDTIAEFNK